MRKPITPQQAIEILATGQTASRESAILALAAAVEEESSYGDPDSSLMDWIANGEYRDKPTFESVAAEWDERE